MAEGNRIVAVALLTAHELERLGTGFDRAWPVDTAPCFGELLARIDAADRDLWRDRDREHLIVTPQVPVHNR